MSDADQTEPQTSEEPTEPTEGDQAAAPVSNQRLRAILAGLVTVAILAVLAIAVFSGDDDDDDPPPPAATTAPSDGTGGESVNEEPGGEELGSLAISGYLCPEASSDESECLDAGSVEITNAVVQLADGRTYELAGVERGEDGVYPWLNIPIGEYTLLADELRGPGDSMPRAVIGSNGQSNAGWTISNLDPNQPAEIRVIFAPVGEGTPVG